MSERVPIAAISAATLILLSACDQDISQPGSAASAQTLAEQQLARQEWHDERMERRDKNRDRDQGRDDDDNGGGGWTP